MDDGPEEGAEAPRAEVQALSALEEALTEALAILPAERVLSRVSVLFPKTTVEVDPARFHGPFKKVSVSMPEELVAAVRERVGAGGFSRYVAEAVEERLRLELMDEYAAELEAVLGPLTPEELEEARREWPDYEG